MNNFVKIMTLKKDEKRVEEKQALHCLSVISVHFPGDLVNFGAFFSSF